MQNRLTIPALLLVIAFSGAANIYLLKQRNLQNSNDAHVVEIKGEDINSSVKKSTEDFEKTINRLQAKIEKQEDTIHKLRSLDFDETPVNKMTKEEFTAKTQRVDGESEEDYEQRILKQAKDIMRDRFRARATA